MATEGYAGFHHGAVRAARLLHQKKHRLARRCFLIEGRLLFQAALESGANIEQVFIPQDEGVSEDKKDPAASKFAALGGLAANKFAALQEQGRVARVDTRTLDSLSTTKTPQGPIAVVSFVDHAARDLESLVHRTDVAAVLVLHNLSDPGNAGTLIRSAEAFGASAVCFGPEAVEPYNDKVVRASMGSLFHLPIIRYESWGEFVAAARSAGLKIVAADARGDDVRVITLPRCVAIVVGQERHGLTDIPRQDVDAIVALPQRPGMESLNAAVAGSLLLYEFARGHGLLGPPHAGTSGA